MDQGDVASRYGEMYGFDADWRRSRIALLGLNDVDMALGEQLRAEVLAPNAAAIIAALYDRLLDDAEVRAIFLSVDMVALKRTQVAHLLDFGSDFSSPNYFEERFHIGRTHAWVGVPLSLYLCAYQILQAEILGHVERLVQERVRCRELMAFVLKIAALDTSLASEIYHVAQIRSLETSVSRLRDERMELRNAAATDALTGLENRNSLLPELARLLTVAVRTGNPLCIIMADLDHFKNVNDTYGHLIGDQVLRDTSARMRAAVRDKDRLGRYGGEEFLVVLQDTSLELAQQVAERVRLRIGEDTFNVIEGGLRVTISQGIAVARDGDSVEKLMARADTALYAAKQAGRNCMRVVDDPD